MKIEGDSMSKYIFTIGYSGFSIEEFIKSLKQYNIKVVIDVRSSAYSERYPDYNKPNIENILKANRIYYRNYVTEFGARQDDLSFYNEDGYLDFEKFSKSEQFQLGIKKICNSIEQGYQVALMCAEIKPIQCHRTILVARTFHAKGFKVIHIIPGGKYITQNQVEDELLNTYFPQRGQLSLFSSSNITDEECICEAYRLQNKKIGYRKEDDSE